jgi:hypothetical protein
MAWSTANATLLGGARRRKTGRKIRKSKRAPSSMKSTRKRRR